MVFKVEKEIGAGILTIETGRMARQADGSATVRYGDSIVLASAQSAQTREGTDFFPLTVDYRENMGAAGKIPGSFFRREGRPTTKETLTCRLIDRPHRPLFPKAYRNEVQVLNFVLSADLENDPDVLAIIASSTALSLSSIPLVEPVGAVRVGLVDGQFIINPTTTQLTQSQMDFVVAGTRDAVVMVEGSAREVTEDQALEALEKAHAAIKEIVEMIEEVKRVQGKPKQVVTVPPEPIALEEELRKILPGKIRQVMFTAGKKERRAAMAGAIDEAIDALVPGEGEEARVVRGVLAAQAAQIERDIVRRAILEGKRLDGRGLADVRNIHIEVGLLPRAHGSALFTRGETQALVTATLGTTMDELKIDGLVEEYYEKFMLHYNFPPMSVGEVKPLRGPGRREIGHGVLAERSLRAVLPQYEDFPYTIRLVSDILESNGSSSMATVCGGTLAMMDAGVTIRAPVAGIAMGLVVEGDRCAVLTDILGDEDHLGDMDFKVAGTASGITALQMDIKVGGISTELMHRAMKQAREARLHVLEKMKEALGAPRSDISKYAPKLEIMKIDSDKIGAVIGPGGRVIRKLQEDYDVKIDIKDDGIVTIFAADSENAHRARQHIEGLTADAEVGRVYKGTVTSVKDFGAFVEILPGKEGLLHVSEMSKEFVKDVTTVAKEGDQIEVKVVDVDKTTGKIRLSVRALTEEPGEAERRAPPSRRGGGGGGERRRR